MRVLVELMDREPVQNVLGSLVFRPEIVVYLCDERDSTRVKESAIYRLFRRRGVPTIPRFLYFDAGDPASIKRVVRAVVKDYPGCVFDFSGGKDLVLLVAGGYCESAGIPAYYIDHLHPRFINVRGCESLAKQFVMPRFSAEDVFALTGAAIRGSGHFDPSAIDPAFERDVESVWAIAQKSPRAWGEFVTVLQAWCAGTTAGELSAGGQRLLEQNGTRLRCNTDILAALAEAGLLTQCHVGRHSVRLRFKSALHKKCLLNTGIWLELFCYVSAKKSGWFDDVRTSVVVDWDDESGPDGTKNEVDLLLVKGITPVFVSCKNGPPSPLALAEIMLLARKFGGSHSRPVVVTAAWLKNEHKAIRQRAADMGVELLDGEVLQRGLVPRLQAIAGGPGARLLRPEDEP